MPKKAATASAVFARRSVTAEVAAVVCRMLRTEDVVCLRPSLLVELTARSFTMAEVYTVLHLFESKPLARSAFVRLISRLSC